MIKNNSMQWLFKYAVTAAKWVYTLCILLVQFTVYFLFFRSKALSIIEQQQQRSKSASSQEQVTKPAKIRALNPQLLQSYISDVIPFPVCVIYCSQLPMAFSLEHFIRLTQRP